MIDEEAETCRSSYSLDSKIDSDISISHIESLKTRESEEKTTQNCADTKHTNYTEISSVKNNVDKRKLREKFASIDNTEEDEGEGEDDNNIEIVYI